MTHYYPDGTAPVVTHTVARIERQLPVPGDVKVRVGSRVEPDDIVLRADYPLGPQIINVARELSILPRQVYSKMKKEEGNKIEKGELIARASVFGGRSVQSPVAGVITTIDRATGYVTITPNPVQLELRAQVRGIVMEVPDKRTVIIETPASYVQGIFGLGGERFGVLRLRVSDRSESLDAKDISASEAYAIIIGGASITAAALRRALEEQVRGVIVGGIEEHELRDFLGDTEFHAWRTGYDSWRLPAPPYNRDPGLTLMITEGFGVRPMSAPLFDTLATYNQQEALIEGATQLRAGLRRPRIVIPLSRVSNVEQVAPSMAELALNSMARILAGPHAGKIGQVVALPTREQRLPSGVLSSVAEVQLVGADATRVLLPPAALEPLLT